MFVLCQYLRIATQQLQIHGEVSRRLLTHVVVVEHVDQHQRDEADDEGQEDGEHHGGESVVLLTSRGLSVDALRRVRDRHATGWIKTTKRWG